MNAGTADLPTARVAPRTYEIGSAAGHDISRNAITIRPVVIGRGRDQHRRRRIIGDRRRGVDERRSHLSIDRRRLAFDILIDAGLLAVGLPLLILRRGPFVEREIGRRCRSSSDDSEALAQ